MTYEFKSSDRSLLGAYPNPFKVENLFLFIGAALFILGAVWGLGYTRDLLDTGARTRGLAALGICGAMFVAGAKLLVTGLTQLRFWLGQNYPKGLAGKPEGDGNGFRSSKITSMLQHQAIAFPEPKGPINGILYSLIPKLIAAPPLLQKRAQANFQALVSAVVSLCSICFSWFLYAGTEHEPLISWLYLPLAGLSLVQILHKPTFSALHDEVEDSVSGGFAVAAIAFIGPVAIPFAARSIACSLNMLPLWAAPLIVFTGSIVCSGFLLWSTLNLLDAAGETRVACEMKAVTMLCPASQLWTEINRKFQREWVDGVPNRQYIEVLPVAKGKERGEFYGSTLQETQPQPSGSGIFGNIESAAGHAHGRILVGLSTFGLVMISATVAWGLTILMTMDAQTNRELVRAFLIFSGLGGVAMTAISSGHFLWSRMHFKSRLVWLDFSGTFQRSVLDIGNTFQGHIKTSSTLTRIEDATIRVWCADIESVSYGKDGERSVIAMAPGTEFAKDLSDHLINFAANQSSIALPTSERDVEKLQGIAAMTKAMNKAMESPNVTTGVWKEAPV